MRTILALLAAATAFSPALAADPVTMATTLTGAAEVPGPGDADGTGTASLTIDATSGNTFFGYLDPQSPSVAAGATDTAASVLLDKGM